ATQQILSDAPFNIGTKNGNGVSLITGNTVRMTIDASGNSFLSGNQTFNNASGNATLSTPDYGSGSGLCPTLTIKAGNCIFGANFATCGTNVLIGGGNGVSDGVNGI